MPGINRLEQIRYQQQIEKEREQERKENNASEKPQNDQKESVSDKLNRFTQESKEGRSEALQTEQKQEQEQEKKVVRKKGRHI